MYPKVTIAVLNHDGIADLKICLSSIRRLNYPNLEIVIIDNGSDKPEVEKLKKLLNNKLKDGRKTSHSSLSAQAGLSRIRWGSWIPPRFTLSYQDDSVNGGFIKLIHLNKNLDFSKAYNKVLKQLNSKYVFLINNDTKLTPYIIDILVSYAQANPDAAVIQPKLLSLKNKKMFDYSGAAGGMVDKLGYPFCLGRVLFTIEKDHGQYDNYINSEFEKRNPKQIQNSKFQNSKRFEHSDFEKSILFRNSNFDIRAFNLYSNEIFWASGAAMFCKTEVIKEVGLFDEDLESFAEDQDLCWRILKAGYRIVSLPQAVMYHKSNASWSKNPNRKAYLIHRNHLLILIKHLTLRRLLIVLPVRIILDYFSIIYYLYSGVPAFTISVLRAHLDFLRLFGKFWRKRTDKYIKRGIFIEKNLMKPASIVWSYFGQKKRKFSDL